MQGKRWLRGCAGCLTLPLLLGALLWVWYYHRPLPREVRRELFPGIVYRREVRRQPRPQVIHLVTVDLDAPGLGFLVTPGVPGQERPLRARTTSRFLQEYDVQVAINGDFFHPWHSNSPWDYYPHPGDPVDADGLAISRGVLYSEIRPGRPALYLTADNEASFSRPEKPTYNALSGDRILVRDGRVLPSPTLETALHPRTAVGIDRDRNRLLLVVVDGRQPNYSEGVTLHELAQILAEAGAEDAINLDGGGSSTLVVEDASGRARVLNTPIDQHIPGRERPVANHLGIYAARAATEQ